MRVAYADKYLAQEEMLLYAMKGFYLLTLPLTKYKDNYHLVFISEKSIILIGKKIALMVNTNDHITAILNKQLDLKQKQLKPYLGILLQKEVESATLGSVCFAEYQPLSELGHYLTKKQLALFHQKYQENVEQKAIENER